MKIEVGKKYRMRNYPAPYEYVEIISIVSNSMRASTIGLEFMGCITCKNESGDTIREMPYYWGVSGNWDNGEGIDDNDLISEVGNEN